MKKMLLLVALGLCLIVGIARSEETATGQLIQQLQGLEQLQGRFQQTQYAADSEQPGPTSSGRFSLLKPSYFSWEIESPDSQLVVTDGEHLWHHDRDLETVTRRPVAGQADLSPLQVLAGDTQLLRERFEVVSAGEGRYTLTPLDDNSGFQSLTLVFVGEQISAMEVVDKLNQRLFIELQLLNPESQLSPADFSFTPPEGADLFYHDR